MNKYIFLFSIFYIVGYSQTYTVTQKQSYLPNTSTYTVKQQGTGAYENPQRNVVSNATAIQNAQNTITNSMNQAASSIAQAAAARNAAYNDALDDNYSTILIDNLINNTGKYKQLCLVNVGGYKSKDNKKHVLQILKDANKYKIIEVGEIPTDSITKSKVLFVSWLRDAQGNYNRITQLSIKNFNGKVIYESTSKNLSHQEILKPLITNYIFTKEMALSKIEEYKKYLDLGVITKEEYDSRVTELKPIILGEN